MQHSVKWGLKVAQRLEMWQLQSSGCLLGGAACVCTGESPSPQPDIGLMFFAVYGDDSFCY